MRADVFFVILSLLLEVIAIKEVYTNACNYTVT